MYGNFWTTSRILSNSCVWHNRKVRAATIRHPCLLRRGGAGDPAPTGAAHVLGAGDRDEQSGGSSKPEQQSSREGAPGALRQAARTCSRLPTHTFRMPSASSCDCMVAGASRLLLVQSSGHRGLLCLPIQGRKPPKKTRRQTCIHAPERVVVLVATAAWLRAVGSRRRAMRLRSLEAP